MDPNPFSWDNVTSYDNFWGSPSAEAKTAVLINPADASQGPDKTPSNSNTCVVQQNESSTSEEAESASEQSESSEYQEEHTRRTSTPWLPEEDAYLRVLVHQYDGKSWTEIAADLSEHFPNRPHRSANMSNQRWHRVLNPRITKGKWTDMEDRQLLEAVKSAPQRRWKDIASMLPGRTDIQVRYRVKKIASWLLLHGVPRDYIE